MDKVPAESRNIAPPSKPSKFRQKPKASNSRGRHDDSFRLKIGKKVEADFRSQRNAKFPSNLPSNQSTLNLQTPIAFTQHPDTTVVKRLPYSTIGIGLAVSELYYRFSEMFRSSRCSVYSLLRVSLAQLDLQHQVSTDGGCSTYPYDSLFFNIPGERKNLTKLHPDNFKVLTYIIETFGRFKAVGSDFVTIIPDELWDNPFFHGFSNLDRVIPRLSAVDRQDAPYR